MISLQIPSNVRSRHSIGLVSIAVKKIMTQASQGQQELVSSYNPLLCHRRKSGKELKQGRKLEAGTDAETKEECCLLNCSSWLTQSVFFQKLRLPVQGVPIAPTTPDNCSELGTLTSVINQGNSLQICLQVIRLESFSPIGKIFPDKSSCVWLTSCQHTCM